jgi:glycosyl transferase family 25
MSDIPILCVSLKRAYERRERILHKWCDEKNYAIEFIDAIDRRDVVSSLDDYKHLNNTKRGLSPGEIACSLSHAKALEIAKVRGYNKCVVVEDDTYPTVAHDTFKSIIDSLDSEFVDCSISILHKDHSNLSSIISESKNNFSRIGRSSYGTCGYLVKNNAYDYLITCYKSLQKPADWYWNSCVSLFALTRSNIPLIIHEGNDTYIGNEIRNTNRVFIP